VSGGGHLNITGLSISGSTEGVGVETSVNLDDLLGGYLADYGLEYTVNHITVDGAQNNTFKLV